MEILAGSRVNAASGLGFQIERLSEQLAAGETVCVADAGWRYRLADATQPEAVARLRELGCDSPILLLAHPGEAQDWLTGLSRRAVRFCRRAWLRPATLHFPHDGEHGLVSRLPELVREWIRSCGTLGLALTGSEAVQELAQATETPLLIVSEEAALDAETPAAPWPQYRWQGESPADMNGVPLSEGLANALTACEILFICTGNTCRSPLAEILFKSMLARRLGCGIDELPAKGWRVRSAGLGASSGLPASEGAQQAAAARSLSLASHQSQPVTLSLLGEADCIFTMTTGHWHALAGRVRAADASLELLSPEGFDIMDPYGAEQEAYDACAQVLQEQLGLRLEEFADELPPAPQAGAPAEPKGAP